MTIRAYKQEIVPNAKQSMNDEIFKPVPGYEDRYEISNYGNLYCIYRRGRTGRWLVNKLNSVNRLGRYNNVFLYLGGRETRKSFGLHHLVALAFIGQPKHNQQINHKDGNPLNNHSLNLEWCDSSFNNTHAHRTGLNSTCGKFEKTPVIGKNIKTGEEIFFYSIGEARRNGFHDASISACCKGKRNKHKGFAWSYQIVERSETRLDEARIVELTESLSGTGLRLA